MTNFWIFQRRNFFVLAVLIAFTAPFFARRNYPPFLSYDMYQWLDPAPVRKFEFWGQPNGEEKFRRLLPLEPFFFPMGSDRLLASILFYNDPKIRWGMRRSSWWLHSHLRHYNEKIAHTLPRKGCESCAASERFTSIKVYEVLLEPQANPAEFVREVGRRVVLEARYHGQGLE